VVERANRVIKTIQDSEKYDLILTEGVFFYSARVDITDKVIRALNAPAANGASR
jgi:outer membrane protein